MPSVKRTFTLPDDVSAMLDKSVPNRERSKFIAAALQKALEERGRNAALLALRGLKPQQIPAGKKGVVDAVRDIRDSTFRELNNG